MEPPSALSTSTPFDRIASSYDKAFTYSQIGSLQRASVWAYLDEHLPHHQSLKILELNCGTGEDALYFAKRGHSVLATDISPQMVQVAAHKARTHEVNAQIKTRVLDINQLHTLKNKESFDLIFSDFGGFNCIHPDNMYKMAEATHELLTPNGRFISVIMPTRCLWETLYFLGKGNFKRAFQRYTYQSVDVPVTGSNVKTWYYSPWFMKHTCQSLFHVKGVKPIGFALPPSYLESFFQKRPKMLMRLNKWEHKLARFSSLSKYSDHYLIDFSKKI